MKTQLLFALATIVSCLCDESPATFPKPLILNFYQKDKGSTVFSDITWYSDPNKRIDDGVSPKADNQSYLKHFKFDSANGPKRSFFWQPEGKESMNCNVTVSGDPKTEQIIFNIDLRTFEHEGEPDLSVVHIHCPEDPGSIDETSMGQYPSDSRGQGDQSPAPNQSQHDSSQDILHWSSNEELYGTHYPRPEALHLNDTNFEHELNVIFQISDQPRYFATKEDAKDKESKLNMDFLWSAIEDQSMTQEEVEYEKYQAGSANRAYRRTWGQADNSNHPSESSLDLSYGASYSVAYVAAYGSSYAASYGGSYIPIYPQSDKFGGPADQNSSNWGGPWSGEVGRMVMGRAQTTSRDFMWTLHDNPEANAMCHFRTLFDPHVKVVYVILDGDEPEIKLDGDNFTQAKWDGKGDKKAFEVTCDAAMVEDKGPEPDIATTRVTTAASSSVQTDEAKSTGDVKEGESDAPKDAEPTPVAAS